MNGWKNVEPGKTQETGRTALEIRRRGTGRQSVRRAKIRRSVFAVGKVFRHDRQRPVHGTFFQNFLPRIPDRLDRRRQGHHPQVRPGWSNREPTCNTMAQMTIVRYLQRYDIDRHIGKIVEVYKRRRDVAVGSIERYFPANIRFIRPEGGLFIWIELPTGISAREILNKCLEKK